jgi:valyl-tRNA synthetase
VINLVSETRNIIAEVAVKKPTLYFKDSDFITENAELISRLAGLSGCRQVEDGRGVHLTNTKIVCWLDIDFEAAQAYVTKLKLQRGVQLKILESLQNRLSNKAYTSNAPKNIVNQTKDKLADEQEKLIKTDKELAKFSNY